MSDVSDAPATVLAALERWGAERDWVGPDPYEGLSSALGRAARGKRPRQLVVQAYKRLPVPPPWPLRARPRPNAKALALALSGYATPAGRRLAGAAEHLEGIPARLEALSAGGAWGYPFDAQTRHLFYPDGSPNAIATCFAVGALLDAHGAGGDPRSLRLALGARPFLLSLRHTAPGHGPFFAYVPSGSELIHNANLLVCGALARLHAVEPDPEAERAAREAAATTIAAQPPDGLWPYGEAPNLGWVDGFHTAYVLEGLMHVGAAFGIGADALERGLGAWRERLIEPDGWARYYPDAHHPLEAHSCASAIDLLTDLAPGRPDGAELLAQAGEVADVAIRELWLPRAGRFAFRRGARGLNHRAFMRWTNAPMFRALARLVSAR